ncbi:unnamed protein product [Symbiodinium sp. CCMP2456]|nr:unnamed protein product [Symbiodinium sp. CCMP2456]
MAGLESSAHFKDRARKYGLAEDLLSEFTKAGIDTFGKLAFICAIQPNSGDDTALLQAIKGLTGKDVPAKEVPTVRRLWYESHTHAMLDLQQQVQKTPDSQPREMPMAERLMQDEIMGIKSESRLSLDSDGNSKMTNQASDLRCDTSGELRLRQCFLRRALAFDQVGLASFVQLEEWSNKMFQALLESPPAGYRYVTVQQVLSADAKLWQIMSQESRGNIAVGTGLDPPLDSLLKKLSLDPLVTACMTPLPVPASQHAPSFASTDGPGKGPGKGNPKKNGKGKNGKGKQTEGDSTANVSLKELLASLPPNCEAKNAEGRFICPFYNKGICRFQKRKSCRFGKHAVVLSAAASCPEDFAQACLDNHDFSESKILELFDLLPKDTSDRDVSGVSFSGGVYCRIKVGLRKACHLFPKTLKVINHFASRAVPSHHYTSFVILDRICTKEHVDTQNAFLPNVVVPLSSFAGGDIMVHAKSQVRLRVCQGPVSFCARAHQHSTSEAQGRRVVLVLFSLLGAVHLGSADRRILRSLGFPLPTVQALESQHIQEPRELFCRPSSDGPSTAALPLADQAQVPWLVEVCAGSAVLSATALSAGWNALPIDQPSCRFHAHTPLFILDMRQSSSSVLLASFASRANVAWYHFGLPCGTCSRARERPLPNAPRPLRDADNLFGKPGLRSAEQEQVTAANQVYVQAVEVLFLAFSRGALVTIENPVRSWLWPLLAALVKKRGPASFRKWYFDLQDFDFDTCMFGSGRAKATRIKGTTQAFQGLARACDGKHQHLSWAPVRLGQGWQFKTKDEAAYPQQLCDFLVAAAGACPSAKAEQWRARELRAQVRAPAGHQSRYAAALIPEFEYQAPLSQVPPHRDYKVLKLSSFGGSFSESSDPVGETVGYPSALGDQTKRGDQDSSSSSGMRGDQGSSSSSGMHGDQGSSSRSGTYGDQVAKRHAGGSSDIVGVYHTMEQHIQLASGLESPSESAHQVPDAVRRNIFKLCTEGPLAVSKLRLQALNQLNSRLKELEAQEAELRRGMHPDVEEVTRVSS